MWRRSVCAQKVKEAAEQLRISSANRQTAVRAQLQKLAPQIMRVLSHVPSRVRESETEPFDDDVVLFLCARAPVVSERMLQRIASVARIRHDDESVQCVTVCCSVLQCVALCCSVMHCVAGSVLLHFLKGFMTSVCVLQCVTVCCTVLQCHLCMTSAIYV